MPGLLNLLITVIVVALVCYIAFWALKQIPLPEPIRVVLIVLVAVILIIFILQRFGMLVGI
jgi:hypothetical protein